VFNKIILPCLGIIEGMKTRKPQEDGQFSQMDVKDECTLHIRKTINRN
jgi:hypothetical protein